MAEVRGWGSYEWYERPEKGRDPVGGKVRSGARQGSGDDGSTGRVEQRTWERSFVEERTSRAGVTEEILREDRRLGVGVEGHDEGTLPQNRP